jgi:hypothetical protein
MRYKILEATVEGIFGMSRRVRVGVDQTSAEWLRTGTFYSKNACPQGSEYEYSATDLY